MNKEKGFTFFELLVVIILVTIFVTLAIDVYMGLLRKERVREAYEAINLIAEAAREYRIRNGEYPALSNIIAINKKYTLNISSKYFDFLLDPSDLSSPPGPKIKAVLRDDYMRLKKGSEITYLLPDQSNNSASAWGGDLYKLYGRL